MEAILRHQDHSHDAQERLRAAHRDARKAQRFPIAVAPGISLRLVRAGKAIVAHAGEEVLPDDFVGDSQEPVKTVLHRLLDERAVIALSDIELERLATPATARYIVADGGAISTRRGILDEGLETRASDFEGGQVDLDDLVRRGAVIDRQPGAPTGKGKAA